MEDTKEKCEKDFGGVDAALLITPGTHCDTLRHTAAHCATLRHTAAHCATLRHTAAHCATLRHAAARCTALLVTSGTHCCTAQHTAAHPATLRCCLRMVHIATHFNTLQHTRCASDYDRYNPRARCAADYAWYTLQHTATHAALLSGTQSNILPRTATLTLRC